MYQPILLTLLAGGITNVLASPAPQRASTVTITTTQITTTTKTTTVTSCSAGSSTTTSRPLTSVTNTNPTTTTTATSAASGVPSYDPNKCVWNVPGAAGSAVFKNKVEYTFFEDALPDGLSVSNYLVEDSKAGAPYNHIFESKNVYTDGDFVNLKVPGVSSSKKKMNISSAEIVTDRSDILYASVRTNAIFDVEPGTCAGIFYYKDDNSEIDIEYLSDPNSKANAVSPIPLWYSNQALNPGTQGTQSTGPAPWDVTAVHEYRIDWTKDFTAFYLDGVLQKKYTNNIPSKPGSWIWNNWANGDIQWSAGPPANDNVMKILNITMYFNTPSDSKTC